jgi:hypothetical protein
MYTVLRFQFSDKQANFVKEIGDRLNAVASDTFIGIDRVGNRFSCSVSTENNWETHIQDITSFIENHSQAIELAIENGFLVEIDIAFDREDFSAKHFSSFDFPFMKILCLNNINLVLTIYS